MQNHQESIRAIPFLPLYLLSSTEISSYGDQGGRAETPPGALSRADK